MQQLVPFSQKQALILAWWADASPYKEADGIIADGSIRSGKTVPMSISFVEWAFARYHEQNFAICGKSIGSVRRNVVKWLVKIMRRRGYRVDDNRTENLLTVTKNGKTNYFYLFGGKDEGSQDLIQGVTLAGVLFDEVALMPESFVNQATGRCSIPGSKYWFNCNPEGPAHWFKLEWLDKAKQKHLIHLHFTMEDNPSLALREKMRYMRQYAGVFFKRMILGLWVVAEGAIYDMWTDDNLYEDGDLILEAYEKSHRWIACDYGTYNPMVFLDILEWSNRIWIEDEYYWDGRKERRQKTDKEYADDLVKFMAGKKVLGVIIDPSAASFIAELKTRGINVKEADNAVLDGIRDMASLIQARVLMANRQKTPNFQREMLSYVWDPKPSDKGKEQPKKQNDHGPDAGRYFVKTIITKIKKRIYLEAAAA